MVRFRWDQDALELMGTYQFDGGEGLVKFLHGVQDTCPTDVALDCEERRALRRSVFSSSSGNCLEVAWRGGGKLWEYWTAWTVEDKGARGCRVTHRKSGRPRWPCRHP